MASVFTYDPDPPRVSSPWSTPGSSTPLRGESSATLGKEGQRGDRLDPNDPDFLAECGITRLDPEPQEGPTEYKLHILLRPRRSFLSLSTGNLVTGSSHSRPSLAVSGTPQDASDCAPKVPAASGQSRQHRLHQLTTQLLWRLQQSSPFHSSSAANLVLPVLPEATPTLNVPQVLSPVLPGLEESQGALYEIGVSDDGTFVGLAEDELDESLINLEAMAASLGCKVEVLRRVAVGYCEWPGESSSEVSSAKLWVAEALVSPDLTRQSGDSHAHAEDNGSSLSAPALEHQSHLKPTEQLHVAIAGPTGAGKSSLLGILSTSALDNGRGKSRLSLLKHRHEISSGVTSSIAQELIGYSRHAGSDSTAEPGPPDVLNYAEGNIASWNDIHVSADGGRLAFLSDLPGSLRYCKSTLRGLVSWRPHYVLLCVPATTSEGHEASDISPVDVSLAYLELCVKLELPLVVVITKLDAATRSNLKETLARILTTIKLTGRGPPLMLQATTDVDEHHLDLQRIPAEDKWDANSTCSSIGSSGMDGVPIVMTSAVTGAGLGKLHALLQSLPLPKTESATSTVSNGDIAKLPESRKVFDINEVFEMPLFKVYSLSNENKRKDDRGIILCGCVRSGSISVGDRLVVGPIAPDSRYESDRNSNIVAPQSRTTSCRTCSEDVTPLRLRSLEPTAPEPQSTGQSYWREVRVVSVRNLRLPVKALSEHQIGTIGVDPVESSSCLGRIRKGMLLADFGRPSPPPSSSLPKESLTAAHAPPPPPPPPPAPCFHTCFVASFPAAEFSSVSPASALAIGGNAMAYIGSIRVAVKLISAESATLNGHSFPSSMAEPDIFALDETSPPESVCGDDGPRVSSARRPLGSDSPSPDGRDVKVNFSFVSSIEWVAVGSRVLIMPSAPTGAAAASASRTPSALSALQGHVGRVCEVLSS